MSGGCHVAENILSLYLFGLHWYTVSMKITELSIKLINKTHYFKNVGRCFVNFFDIIHMGNNRVTYKIKFIFLNMLKIIKFWYKQKTSSLSTYSPRNHISFFNIKSIHRLLYHTSKESCLSFISAFFDQSFLKVFLVDSGQCSTKVLIDALFL